MKVINGLIKNNSKLFFAAIVLVVASVAILFFTSMSRQDEKPMENLLPVVDNTYNRDHVVEWLEENYMVDSEEIDLIAKERYLVCDRKKTKMLKETSLWSMPGQYGFKISSVKKGEEVFLLLKDSRFDLFKIQAEDVSGWVASKDIEDPYCFSFNEILSED